MIVDIKNSHDELENSKLKWQFAVEGNGMDFRNGI